MIQLSLITVDLHFPGCKSLKDKRSRMAGLKERLGRKSSIALVESGFQDIHQRSEWSILVMADSGRGLDRLRSEVESELERVDAVLMNVKSENI